MSPSHVQQSNAPKKGKIVLPLKFLDMADMWDVVERPQDTAEGRDMYGEYTPAALRTHSGNLAGWLGRKACRGGVANNVLIIITYCRDYMLS